VAFRERQPSNPGRTEAGIEYPWLGTIRRHGDGQLIASISIPPAIRPARASGDAKDYAAEHAPRLLADNRLPVPASLRDALFLEGFTITGNGTEIAFDYGALDMIVVQADPGGQCYSVTLCP
jgi:hypothetical protein